MLPNEKLHVKGPENLDTWELVSILFGHGTKKENVFACAKRIVNDYGVAIPSNHHPKILKTQYKLTKYHSAKLSACIELGHRWFSAQRIMPSMDTSEKVFTHLQEMSTWRKEAFRGLYLNARYQLIWDEIISMGDLTSSNVHPREVFIPAVKVGAAAIIIVHNHPSGQPTPSLEDKHTTDILIQSSLKNGWYSFQEHGLIDAE